MSILPANLHKQEAWRYSDVKRLLRPQWQILPAPPPASSHQKDEKTAKLQLNIIQGRLDEKSLGNLPPGLHIDVQEKQINKEKNNANLSKAQEAFYTQTINIRLDKYVDKNMVLHLDWHWEIKGEQAFAAAPVIDLKITEKAKLTLNEKWTVDGDNALKDDQLESLWALPVYDIHLGQKSHLCWTRYSALPAAMMLTATQNISLQKEANLEYYTAVFDQGYSRFEQNYHLEAEQSKLLMKGCYIAGHNSMIIHDLTTLHQAKNCQSQILLHGIADDKASAVFQAKTIVAKHADFNQADQTHKALLLSDHAEVNAKPALEIYADEVECTHGSTIGDIDPKQLFYLRARGIDEKLARALLIQGFLQEPLGQDAGARPLLAIYEARG